MEVRSALRPSKKTCKVEVEHSKGGRPIPVVNGKFLHSRYDPEAEAVKWAAEQLAKKPKARIVVVLGMGFAYHLQALRDAAGRDVTLVVFEPLSEIVSAYARVVAKNIENTRLWPSPSPQDVVDAVAEVLTPSLINQVLVLGHPPSIESDPAGYQTIMASIHSAIDQIAMSLTTGWGFGFEWIENALRNVRRLPELPFLNQTASILRRAPPAALVLGAGPSLDGLWDVVGRSRVLKLAADTALEPMERRDIFPHLAFLFDSQTENTRLIEEIRTEEQNLVTALEVQPAIFGKRWRNLFVAGCDQGLLSWLEKRGGFSAGDLKQGGSVVTCAFDLARQAGCSPIYFGGVDLSFSSHRVYCRGTAYERRAIETQSRFLPVEQAVLEMKAGRTERTVANRPTQDNLYNYYRWLKDEIGRTPQPVAVLNAAGLLSEFLPANGAERIVKEEYPAGFDEPALRTTFKPNGIVTRGFLDEALSEFRTKLRDFLNPDHFSDPDSLEKALAKSDVAEVLETVVQPAAAVSRYEREKGGNSEAILKELRERLAGVMKWI